MPATLDELNEFHRFAAELIRESETPLEFGELLEMWYDRREREQVVEILHEALADVDAGRCRPVQEQLDELRQEYGFSES